MKKLNFVLLLCTFSTLNLFSQIKITSNNKIGIGTAPDNNYSITMNGDVFLKGAYNNYIRLFNSATSGGPYVAVDPSSTQVGMSFIGYNNPWYQATLKYLYVLNGTYLYGTFVNGSDKRLKKDINQLGFDKNLFGQLNPVTYNLVDSLQVTKKNGNKSTLIFDKKNYPIKGFIAQDLQKIYPELVEEDSETGLLAIKPLEFIPILVKAIQAQQGEIDALKKEIKSASNPSKVKSSSTSLPLDENLPTALYQNNPNPFSQSTEIKYYLPKTVNKALLCIYDLQGKQLKQITIAERGEGSQTINGAEFSAGIYLYGLIADGQQVDVKRMILTE